MQTPALAEQVCRSPGRLLSETPYNLVSTWRLAQMEEKQHNGAGA